MIGNRYSNSVFTKVPGAIASPCLSRDAATVNSFSQHTGC